MGEIFIPEKLFGNININNISENLINLLKENFNISNISSFQTKHCIGTHILIKDMNQDVLSVLNGEFGETYFTDYDFLSYDFEITGTKILKPENITNNIIEISKQFDNIIEELSSDTLLTNSKKNEIEKNIKKTFFTISGILFLLYTLRGKSQENLEDLREYKGNIEFEGYAALVSETSKTKYIELTAQINKFEEKSEIFFLIIKKIFL